MLKLARVVTILREAQTVLPIKQFTSQQCRYISALYITGDKAMEHCVTLQPYMDFENTLKNTEKLEFSITKRGMKTDLKKIQKEYATFKDVRNQLQHIEDERDKVAKQLKNAKEAEQETLKEHGKTLRNALKSLKQDFYPIEDKFIHAFLNLPNELHHNCPVDNKEKVLYRSSIGYRLEDAPNHLERKDLIRFIDNSMYYMMDTAADFDFQCTQALMRYFVNTGSFIASANPDFVRCVLLEAYATPLENYHMVKEENLQNSINVAYLTGGGSFESFLGGVTRLSIYPTVLPLRLVSSGRSYRKVNLNLTEGSTVQENLYTATQSNTVQVFVATSTALEADEQMEDILNLTVNFYKELGIHFRIIYSDASTLTPSESLRAEIQVYSPAQKCYICTGSISNYTNFVSQRILFTAYEQKEYKFLHLVGGPVLYTTRLIAALIENGIPFERCKLLGAFKPKESKIEETTIEASGITEFKDLFK